MSENSVWKYLLRPAQTATNKTLLARDLLASEFVRVAVPEMWSFDLCELQEAVRNVWGKQFTVEDSYYGRLHDILTTLIWCYRLSCGSTQVSMGLVGRYDKGIAGTFGALIELGEDGRPFASIIVPEVFTNIPRDRGGFMIRIRRYRRDHDDD